MPPGDIRCPQCHKPTSWEDNVNRPFCSERCRLLDLGAWAGESYRIPDKALTKTDEESE